MVRKKCEWFPGSCIILQQEEIEDMYIGMKEEKLIYSEKALSFFSM